MERTIDNLFPSIDKYIKDKYNIICNLRSGDEVTFTLNTSSVDTVKITLPDGMYYMIPTYYLTYYLNNTYSNLFTKKPKYEEVSEKILEMYNKCSNSSLTSMYEKINENVRIPFLETIWLNTNIEVPYTEDITYIIDVVNYVFYRML